MIIQETKKNKQLEKKQAFFTHVFIFLYVTIWITPIRANYVKVSQKTNAICLIHKAITICRQHVWL